MAQRHEDWKKAQAQRLEDERAAEKQSRQAWFDSEKTIKEEEKKKTPAAWWSSWGSSHWGPSQKAWSRWAWSGSESSATGRWKKKEDLEPTANEAPVPWLDPGLPIPRTPEQDIAALRNVAITPASFLPQRHVMMAMGRPVVVPTLDKNHMCFLLGCSWAGGRAGSGGVEMAGVRRSADGVGGWCGLV